ADATLALFLSFCVLLVGTILGGGSAWLQCGYVAAAVAQLRCQARLSLLGTVNRLPAPGARAPAWLLGVGLAAVCALLVAGLQRGLRLLPAPARPPATVDRGGADERRRLGLPDDFRFDGEGELLPARGERLVEV